MLDRPELLTLWPDPVTLEEETVSKVIPPGRIGSSRVRDLPWWVRIWWSSSRRLSGLA